MMGDESVILSDLTTGYEGRHGCVEITRHVNAGLRRGELTCLLGPNGSGKSTLLRTISGFQPALEGAITINGRVLESYDASELSKMIGVVLTERLSLNNMTVDELVSMGRSPYTGFWGRLSESDHKIVDDAISLMNICDIRHRMVQTLSDGERQKVMIAKALAQETPIILLDEPTAFLDYPSKVEIMRLLHMLSHERGKLIFLSSHDLELALQIADKIWIVDKRYGLKVGSPEDLSLSGDLERYFVNDGVFFDIRSGLFKIKNRIVASVGLEGPEPEYGMVRKALVRNGISVDDNAGSRIKISNGGYEFEGRTFDSIGDLVHAASNHPGIINK